jgi:hypothetical protein
LKPGLTDRLVIGRKVTLTLTLNQKTAFWAQKISCMQGKPQQQQQQQQQICSNGSTI